MTTLAPARAFARLLGDEPLSTDGQITKDLLLHGSSLVRYWTSGDGKLHAERIDPASVSFQKQPAQPDPIQRGNEDLVPKSAAVKCWYCLGPSNKMHSSTAPHVDCPRCLGTGAVQG